MTWKIINMKKVKYNGQDKELSSQKTEKHFEHSKTKEKIYQIRSMRWNESYAQIQVSWDIIGDHYIKQKDFENIKNDSMLTNGRTMTKW